jgi:hypothetical protein
MWVYMPMWVHDKMSSLHFCNLPAELGWDVMVRTGVQCGELEGRNGKSQLPDDENIFETEATIRAVRDVFREPFWVVPPGS